jgi:hypothetical protein
MKQVYVRQMKITSTSSPPPLPSPFSSSVAQQPKLDRCLFNGLLPLCSVFYLLIPGFNFSFINICLYTIPPSVSWSPSLSTSLIPDSLFFYYPLCCVIGDFPWRTPISNLHAHLQIIPIHQFIHHLTDKFFVSCPVHPNPLIRNTGNYTLEDLHRQYTKYRHKRTKHKLL